MTVLWFTRCCERREGAEKVDKLIKYCSSCGLSLLLCILAFYICSVEVNGCPLFCTRSAPQARHACPCKSISRVALHRPVPG